MKNRFRPQIKAICWIVLHTFIISLITPPQMSHAQTASTTGTYMPQPGMMVTQSPEFNPPLLKGIKINPNNPLELEFIVDEGDLKDLNPESRATSHEPLEKESKKLIKYFLSALTTPDEDMWVNLAPNEKDRIVPESFGKTEMGRDLLAQDYLLKQLAASLTYPESDLGKKFWDEVHKNAYEKNLTTEIPKDILSKVWITPNVAKVFENNGSAFVVEGNLKVQIKDDSEEYGVKSEEQKNVTPARSVIPSRSVIPAKAGIQANGSPIKSFGDDKGSDLIRKLILPEIEKEINKGKNFVQLRQIYHSLILATWFKQRLKESIFAKGYADQNKIKGVDIDDKQAKQKIYHKYIKAFKKGVYNYIKEDYDPIEQQVIPRKYFSGGYTGIPKLQFVDYAVLADSRQPMEQLNTVSVRLDPNAGNPDPAMMGGRNFPTLNGRWYFKGAEFDENYNILTYHKAKRIKNKKGEIEPEFLIDGKNKPREIYLRTREMVHEEKSLVESARKSLDIPDDIQIRTIKRDALSISNRIYGASSDNIIFIREDILKRGTPNQIKEAIDHEYREMKSYWIGNKHTHVRKKQFNGNLRELIRLLSDSDKVRAERIDPDVFKVFEEKYLEYRILRLNNPRKLDLFLRSPSQSIRNVVKRRVAGINEIEREMNRVGKLYLNARKNVLLRLDVKQFSDKTRANLTDIELREIGPSTRIKIDLALRAAVDELNKARKVYFMAFASYIFNSQNDYHLIEKLTSDNDVFKQFIVKEMAGGAKDELDQFRTLDLNLDEEQDFMASIMQRVGALQRTHENVITAVIPLLLEEPKLISGDTAMLGGATSLMGRWRFKGVSFDSQTGVLTFHQGKRIKNKKGKVEQDFLIDGKNKPREIYLRTREMAPEEKALVALSRESLSIPNNIQVRVIKRDALSVWHQIYGATSENIIFVREDILRYGTEDQVKEAIDHQYRTITSWMPFFRRQYVRAMQFNGNLSKLISKLKNANDFKSMDVDAELLKPFEYAYLSYLIPRLGTLKELSTYLDHADQNIRDFARERFDQIKEAKDSVNASKDVLFQGEQFQRILQRKEDSGQPQDDSLLERTDEIAAKEFVSINGKIRWKLFRSMIIQLIVMQHDYNNIDNLTTDSQELKNIVLQEDTLELFGIIIPDDISREDIEVMRAFNFQLEQEQEIMRIAVLRMEQLRQSEQNYLLVSGELDLDAPEGLPKNLFSNLNPNIDIDLTNSQLMTASREENPDPIFLSILDKPSGRRYFLKLYTKESWKRESLSRRLAHVFGVNIAPSRFVSPDELKRISDVKLKNTLETYFGIQDFSQFVIRLHSDEKFVKKEGLVNPEFSGVEEALAFILFSGHWDYQFSIAHNTRIHVIEEKNRAFLYEFENCEFNGEVEHIERFRDSLRSALKTLSRPSIGIDSKRLSQAIEKIKRVTVMEFRSMAFLSGYDEEELNIPAFIERRDNFRKIVAQEIRIAAKGWSPSWQEEIIPIAEYIEQDYAMISKISPEKKIKADYSMMVNDQPQGQDEVFQELGTIEFDPRSASEMEEMIDELKQRAGIVPEDVTGKILVVGVAPSFDHLDALAKAFPNARIIDAEWVKKDAEELKTHVLSLPPAMQSRIEIIHADARNLKENIDDDSIQLALFLNVLEIYEHSMNKAETREIRMEALKQILAESKRVLEPNGVISVKSTYLNSMEKSYDTLKELEMKELWSNMSLVSMVFKKPESFNRIFSSPDEQAFLRDIDHLAARSLILFGGPSNAGKTHRAKELEQREFLNDRKVVRFPYDYYSKKEGKQLRHGIKDLDDITSFDWETMWSDIAKVLKGEKVTLPERGPEYDGTLKTIELGENDVLLVDGIHMLHPDFIKGLPDDVEKLTVFNNAPKELRFLRRFARARPTDGGLDVWRNVLEAEDEHIYPFKNNVEYVFESGTAEEVLRLAKDTQELRKTIREKADQSKDDIAKAAFAEILDGVDRFIKDHAMMGAPANDDDINNLQYQIQERLKQLRESLEELEETEAQVDCAKNGVIEVVALINDLFKILKERNSLIDVLPLATQMQHSLALLIAKKDKVDLISTKFSIVNNENPDQLNDLLKHHDDSIKKVARFMQRMIQGLNESMERAFKTDNPERLEFRKQLYDIFFKIMRASNPEEIGALKMKVSERRDISSEVREDFLGFIEEKINILIYLYNDAERKLTVLQEEKEKFMRMLDRTINQMYFISALSTAKEEGQDFLFIKKAVKDYLSKVSERLKQSFAEPIDQYLSIVEEELTDLIHSLHDFVSQGSSDTLRQDVLTMAGQIEREKDSLIFLVSDLVHKISLCHIEKTVDVDSLIVFESFKNDVEFSKASQERRAVLEHARKKVVESESYSIEERLVAQYYQSIALETDVTALINLDRAIQDEERIDEFRRILLVLKVNDRKEELHDLNASVNQALDEVESQKRFLIGTIEYVKNLVTVLGPKGVKLFRFRKNKTDLSGWLRESVLQIREQLGKHINNDSFAIDLTATSVSALGRAGYDFLVIREERQRVLDYVGRVRLKVLVSNEGFLIIEVDDNGVGLEKEQLERLFEEDKITVVEENDLKMLKSHHFVFGDNGEALKEVLSLFKRNKHLFKITVSTKNARGYAFEKTLMVDNAPGKVSSIEKREQGTNVQIKILIPELIDSIEEDLIIFEDKWQTSDEAMVGNSSYDDPIQTLRGPLKESEFDRVLDISYGMKAVQQTIVFDDQLGLFIRNHPEIREVLYGLRDISFVDNDISEEEAKKLKDLFLVLNHMLGTSFDVLFLDENRAVIISREDVRFAAMNGGFDQKKYAYPKAIKNVLPFDIGIEFLIAHDFAVEKGFFYDHSKEQLPGAPDKLASAVALEEAVSSGEEVFRHEDNPIKDIAFPSAREAELLEASIRSHLDAMKMFGHILPTIWVFDETDGDVAQQKQSMLKRLAKEYNASIRYVGVEEKEKFLSRLFHAENIKSLGTEQELRTLFFQNKVLGTNRNFVQLYLSDRVYSTIDDDSFSYVTMPKSLNHSEPYKSVNGRLRSVIVGIISRVVSPDTFSQQEVTNIEEGEKRLNEVRLGSHMIQSLIKEEKEKGFFFTSKSLTGILNKLYQGKKENEIDQFRKKVFQYLEKVVVKEEVGEQDFVAQRHTLSRSYAEVSPITGEDFIQVPVDAYGIHGRYIGHNISELRVLQFPDVEQDLIISGKVTGGGIGIIPTSSNIFSPGSIASSLDGFANSMDLTLLRGGGGSRRFLYNFLNAVVDKFILCTVTMTTIDNRFKRGLVPIGELDSRKLGVMLQDGDASFKLLSPRISLDHNPSFNRIRHHYLKDDFDVEKIVESYMELEVTNHALNILQRKGNVNLEITELVFRILSVIDGLFGIIDPDSEVFSYHTRKYLKKGIKGEEIKQKFPAKEKLARSLIDGFENVLGVKLLPYAEIMMLLKEEAKKPNGNIVAKKITKKKKVKKTKKSKGRGKRGQSVQVEVSEYLDDLGADDLARFFINYRGGIREKLEEDILKEIERIKKAFEISPAIHQAAIEMSEAESLPFVSLNDEAMVAKKAKFKNVVTSFPAEKGTRPLIEKLIDNDWIDPETFDEKILLVGFGGSFDQILDVARSFPHSEILAIDWDEASVRDAKIKAEYEYDDVDLEGRLDIRKLDAGSLKQTLKEASVGLILVPNVLDWYEDTKNINTQFAKSKLDSIIEEVSYVLTVGGIFASIGQIPSVHIHDKLVKARFVDLMPEDPWKNMLFFQKRVYFVGADKTIRDEFNQMWLAENEGQAVPYTKTELAEKLGVVPSVARRLINEYNITVLDLPRTHQISQDGLTLEKWCREIRLNHRHWNKPEKIITVPLTIEEIKKKLNIKLSQAAISRRLIKHFIRPGGKKRKHSRMAERQTNVSSEDTAMLGIPDFVWNLLGAKKSPDVLYLPSQEVVENLHNDVVEIVTSDLLRDELGLDLSKGAHRIVNVGASLGYDSVEFRKALGEKFSNNNELEFSATEITRGHFKAIIRSKKLLGDYRDALAGYLKKNIKYEVTEEDINDLAFVVDQNDQIVQAMLGFYADNRQWYIHFAFAQHVYPIGADGKVKETQIAMNSELLESFIDELGRERVKSLIGGGQDIKGSDDIEIIFNPVEKKLSKAGVNFVVSDSPSESGLTGVSLITVNNVIGLVSESDRDAFFNEMNDMLAPGGVLIIKDGQRKNIYSTIDVYQKIGQKLVLKGKTKGVFHAFSLEGEGVFENYSYQREELFKSWLYQRNQNRPDINDIVRSLLDGELLTFSDIFNGMFKSDEQILQEADQWLDTKLQDIDSAMLVTSRNSDERIMDLRPKVNGEKFLPDGLLIREKKEKVTPYILARVSHAILEVSKEYAFQMPNQESGLNVLINYPKGMDSSNARVMAGYFSDQENVRVTYGLALDTNMQNLARLTNRSNGLDAYDLLIDLRSSSSKADSFEIVLFREGRLMSATLIDAILEKLNLERFSKKKYRVKVIDNSNTEYFPDRDVFGVFRRDRKVIDPLEDDVDTVELPERAWNLPLIIGEEAMGEVGLLVNLPKKYFNNDVVGRVAEAIGVEVKKGIASGRFNIVRERDYPRVLVAYQSEQEESFAKHMVAVFKGGNGIETNISLPHPRVRELRNETYLNKGKESYDFAFYIKEVSGGNQRFGNSFYQIVVYRALKRLEKESTNVFRTIIGKTRSYKIKPFSELNVEVVDLTSDESMLTGDRNGPSTHSKEVHIPAGRKVYDFIEKDEWDFVEGLIIARDKYRIDGFFIGQVAQGIALSLFKAFRGKHLKPRDGRDRMKILLAYEDPQQLPFMEKMVEVLRGGNNIETHLSQAGVKFSSARKLSSKSFKNKGYDLVFYMHEYDPNNSDGKVYWGLRGFIANNLLFKDITVRYQDSIRGISYFKKRPFDELDVQVIDVERLVQERDSSMIVRAQTDAEMTKELVVNKEVVIGQIMHLPKKEVTEYLLARMVDGIDEHMYRAQNAVEHDTHSVDEIGEEEDEVQDLDVLVNYKGSENELLAMAISGAFVSKGAWVTYGQGIREVTAENLARLTSTEDMNEDGYDLVVDIIDSRYPEGFLDIVLYSYGSKMSVGEIKRIHSIINDREFVQFSYERRFIRDRDTVALPEEKFFGEMVRLDKQIEVSEEHNARNFVGLTAVERSSPLIEKVDWLNEEGLIVRIPEKEFTEKMIGRVAQGIARDTIRGYEKRTIPHLKERQYLKFLVSYEDRNDERFAKHMVEVFKGGNDIVTHLTAPGTDPSKLSRMTFKIFAEDSYDFVFHINHYVHSRTNIPYYEIVVSRAGGRLKKRTAQIVRERIGNVSEYYMRPFEDLKGVERVDVKAVLEKMTQNLEQKESHQDRMKALRSHKWHGILTNIDLSVTDESRVVPDKVIRAIADKLKKKVRVGLVSLRPYEVDSNVRVFDESGQQISAIRDIKEVVDQIEHELGAEGREALKYLDVFPSDASYGFNVANPKQIYDFGHEPLITRIKRRLRFEKNVSTYLVGYYQQKFGMDYKQVEPMFFNERSLGFYDSDLVFIHLPKLSEIKEDDNFIEQFIGVLREFFNVNGKEDVFEVVWAIDGVLIKRKGASKERAVEKFRELVGSDDFISFDDQGQKDGEGQALTNRPGGISLDKFDSDNDDVVSTWLAIRKKYADAWLSVVESLEFEEIPFDGAMMARKYNNPEDIRKEWNQFTMLELFRSCEWGFDLVREKLNLSKHSGISFLIFDFGLQDEFSEKLLESLIKHKWQVLSVAKDFKLTNPSVKQFMKDLSIRRIYKSKKDILRVLGQGWRIGEVRDEMGLSVKEDTYTFFKAVGCENELKEKLLERLRIENWSIHATALSFRVSDATIKSLIRSFKLSRTEGKLKEKVLEICRDLNWNLRRIGNEFGFKSGHDYYDLLSDIGVVKEFRGVMLIYLKRLKWVTNQVAKRFDVDYLVIEPLLEKLKIKKPHMTKEEVLKMLKDKGWNLFEVCSLLESIKKYGYVNILENYDVIAEVRAEVDKELKSSNGNKKAAGRKFHVHPQVIDKILKSKKESDDAMVVKKKKDDVKVLFFDRNPVGKVSERATLDLLMEVSGKHKNFMALTFRDSLIYADEYWVFGNDIGLASWFNKGEKVLQIHVKGKRTREIIVLLNKLFSSDIRVMLEQKGFRGFYIDTPNASIFKSFLHRGASPTFIPRRKSQEILKIYLQLVQEDGYPEPGEVQRAVVVFDQSEQNRSSPNNFIVSWGQDEEDVAMVGEAKNPLKDLSLKTGYSNGNPIVVTVDDMSDTLVEIKRDGGKIVSAPPQELIDEYTRRLRSGAVQIVNTGDRFKDVRDWWIKFLPEDVWDRVVVVSLSGMFIHQYDALQQQFIELFNIEDSFNEQQRNRWQTFREAWLRSFKEVSELYLGQLSKVVNDEEGMTVSSHYLKGVLDDRMYQLTLEVDNKYEEFQDITEINQINKNIVVLNNALKLAEKDYQVPLIRAGENRRDAVDAYLKGLFYLNLKEDDLSLFQINLIPVGTITLDSPILGSTKGKGLLRVKSERIVEKIFDQEIDWENNVEIHGDSFKGNDGSMAEALPNSKGVSVGKESAEGLPKNVVLHQSDFIGPKALAEVLRFSSEEISVPPKYSAGVDRWINDDSDKPSHEEAIKQRHKDRLTPEKIQKARELLKKFGIVEKSTPLLEEEGINKFLSEFLGHGVRLHMKSESHNPTGSFKDRAQIFIYAYVDMLVREKLIDKLVSLVIWAVSTGNHGRATVNAVNQAIKAYPELEGKLMARIVLGSDALGHKVQNILDEIAHKKGSIVRIDKDGIEIKDYESGLAFVEASVEGDLPHNRQITHADEYVIAGYSTMAVEALEQLIEKGIPLDDGTLDVLTALGSGGLTDGWLETTSRHSKIRVFGGASPPADRTYQQLKFEEVIPQEVKSRVKVDGTMATPEDFAVDHMRDSAAGALIVTEMDAVYATALLKVFGISVEPTSGLPLASILLHGDLFKNTKNFVIPLTSKNISDEDSQEIDDIVKEQGVNGIKEYFNFRRKEIVNDRAMVATTGGVDFRPEEMQLFFDRQGVDKALFSDWSNLDFDNIEGFTPVIIDIKPLVDLPMFLGLKKNNSQEIQLSSR